VVHVFGILANIYVEREEVFQRNELRREFQKRVGSVRKSQKCSIDKGIARDDYGVCAGIDICPR